MRDRLVELIKGLGCVDTWNHYTDDFKEPNPVEELADHLLANGVIVPPCKVGDVVYVITVKRPCYACTLCTDFCHKNCSFNDKNKLVIKIARVCGITIDGKINKVHLDIDKSKICHSYKYTCWFEDFGKTVFLTKKEAEAKLKEGVING